MSRIIYLSFALFFGVLSSIAQGDDKLPISVVVPSQMEGLTYGQVSKIHSRMLKMVTNYGISGEGYSNNFVLYPKYEIYDYRVIEGLRNVHVVEAEFTLVVKEIKTRKVFAVFTQEITGDDYSKSRAIDATIKNFKVSGIEVERFLTEAKTKILEYYRTHCDQIYTEASSQIRQNRFEEAIFALYSVPREVGGDCYGKIQAKLDEAYLGYLNRRCARLIMNAKAELSLNNEVAALGWILSVEPESQCYPEAEQLIKKIDENVREQEIQNAMAALKRQNATPPEIPPGSNVAGDMASSGATQSTAPNIPDALSYREQSSSQQQDNQMKYIVRTEAMRDRHQDAIQSAMSDT